MLPVLMLGSLRIFPYGVMMALGGACSTLFCSTRRKQMGLRTSEDFWLFVNVVLFCGFIGGRILFLIEYVPFSQPGFLKAALSFSSGFSVLGAFGCIACGIWLFCRRLKLDFARVFDYVSFGAPLWHFFGRLGCLAAGCCYGRPTALAWGVTFSDSRSMVPHDLLGVPLHPTQLYEAFGAVLTTALLYRFVLLPVEQGRKRHGSVTAWYFIAYGLLRFFVESLRGDTVPLALGLSVAQAISLIIIGLGSAWLRTRSKS